MSKYDNLNPEVYKYIPFRSAILDLGCDTGKLGYLIKKNKLPRELVGVEINKKAAKTASKYYDKIFLSDLNKLKPNSFSKYKFDCIVFSDILEHLINPEQVLKYFLRYLSPKGTIVISVPNVVFILNRILITFGIFEYRNKGIMDNTHLHLYTYSSAQKLIKKCGYKIIYKKGYINTRKSLRFLNIFARLYPGLFAYQLLFIAGKE